MYSLPEVCKKRAASKRYTNQTDVKEDAPETTEHADEQIFIAESNRKSQGNGKRDDRGEGVKEENPPTASVSGSNNRLFTYFPIMEIEEEEDENSLED